jgi:hypothetical protein
MKKRDDTQSCARQKDQYFCNYKTLTLLAKAIYENRYDVSRQPSLIFIYFTSEIYYIQSYIFLIILQS